MLKRKITLYMLEQLILQKNFKNIDINDVEFVTTTVRDFSNYPVHKNDAVRLLNLLACWYFDLSNGNLESSKQFAEDLSDIVAKYQQYGMSSILTTKEGLSTLYDTFKIDEPSPVLDETPVLEDYTVTEVVEWNSETDVVTTQVAKPEKPKRKIKRVTK